LRLRSSTRSVILFFAAIIARRFFAANRRLLATRDACVLLIAVVFAVVRASRKHHSWTAAVADSGKAWHFFVFAVVASALLLAFLFVIFFVRDAPDQMTLAMNTIDGLKSQHVKRTTELLCAVLTSNN